MQFFLDREEIDAVSSTEAQSWPSEMTEGVSSTRSTPQLLCHRIACAGSLIHLIIRISDIAFYGVIFLPVSV